MMLSLVITHRSLMITSYDYELSMVQKRNIPVVNQDLVNQPQLQIVHNKFMTYYYVVVHTIGVHSW